MRNNFTEKWSRLFAAKRYHSETGTIELSALEQQELLDDAQSLDRWIPVDEALPELQQRILAYDSDRDMYFDCIYNGGSSFVMNMGSVCVKMEVTHWQPLPKSAKL